MLTITLLGSPAIALNGRSLQFPSIKAIALLAYLAASGMQHDRAELAALLWPESDNKRARGALRYTLSLLKKALGDGYLLANRRQIGLNPQADWEADVVTVRRLLAPALGPENGLEDGCLEGIEKGIALYQADFLQGFTLRDSAGFNAWTFIQGEALRRDLATALQRLAAYYQAQQQWDTAVAHTHRWLNLDPLHEPAHRQLMTLLACMGQRSLALKQYEQCRTLLQRELHTDVSPETKTLSQQIKLRPNFSLQNLPVALTPFIGREKEMATLTSWLAETAVRLISITGLGGMGKTRLALAAARRFLHPATTQPAAPFADGIYFIDLAPLTAPDQLETAVADVLHLHLASRNGRSPQQQIIDYLSHKQMLLIFDNFEHLLSGASLITSLLQAAPHLTILVTSRQQLRLRGEKVFSLHGLAYQNDSTELTPDAKFDNDAAQMFVSTAAQIAPAPGLSHHDRDQINEICRLVEGTPLAVELAAQWVDTLPLDVIADELRNGIARLEAELLDLPPRQRSMQVIFQSSWRRLPESARRVLARASVFQGGFTLDAAVTILGATHRTLSLLVNHSLLRFDRANKRYHCHELLRQYAAAHLAANPDLAHQTRQKHLAYFCRLAEQGEQHIRGGDTVLWMKRLGQEKGNWQAAFAWGLENHLETAAQMAIHLSLFWFSSGQMRLGQKLHEKLLRRQNELPDRVRGWVLTWYTAMIWVQGRLQESKQLALETYHLFQNLNDAPGIIMSYHHQYVAAFYQGDLETAASYNDLALEIARHDPAVPSWFLRVCLQNQSNHLAEVGQTEAAYRAASKSYQLSQENRDLFTGNYALATLARLAIKRGAFAEAQALCRQALANAQDMNDPRMESIQYLVLGNIALAERDFPAAVDHLETAVAICDMTNNTDILDEATMLLGRDAYTGIGDYASAFAALQRWAKICLQLNNEANMAACLAKLAQVYWRLNPGNLASVRWLAAAAAWRDAVHDPGDALPIRTWMEPMQKQLSKAEFNRHWEAGFMLTLRAGLGEAAAV